MFGIQFTQYVGRVPGWRAQITGLPAWARSIVGIFALPGIVLAALSLLVFLVNILALLILALPVYLVLKRITSPATIVTVPTDDASPGVKRVEATIVE